VTDAANADPGWGAPRDVAFALVPFVPPSMARTGGDPLIVTRHLFLRFCSAIVLIGVVVLLLGTDPSSDGAVDLGPALAILGAIGVALVVAAEVVGRRPLDCTSPRTLAGSFRTRFFVRLALGEAAALIGFVALFVVDSPVPYFVGAVFTAVVFARLVPTRAHLAADQLRLRARGCTLDLVAALRGLDR